MGTKKILAGLCVALMGSAAQATVIHTVELPDVYTSQVAGATTVDFESGTCSPYWSCTGIGNGQVVIGNQSGVYASPFGIDDHYLTVGTGAASLQLDHAYDYFGLFWGSIDTYNHLSFYLGDAWVDTFSGSELPPLQADGNQIAWTSNRYVNFFFTDGALFDRVVLTSTGNAFESDNHAVATVTVPEPGTLALLAVGLLGIGVRRRVPR